MSNYQKTAAVEKKMLFLKQLRIDPVKGTDLKCSMLFVLKSYYTTGTAELIHMDFQLIWNSMQFDVLIIDNDTQLQGTTQF